MGMNLTLGFIFSILISAQVWGLTLKLPQGKGKCPAFSFEAEKDWILKSDRPKGDRWWVINSKTKSQIARFDFKLSNTDQKQLQVVEETEIKLNGFSLDKYTVTTSFPEVGQKATEGLVTSYQFKSGKLEGLVIMSPEYSTNSELDKKIEKIISSIKLGN